VPEYNLKKLALDDEKLFYEFAPRIEGQETPKLEELLGFQLSENRCFIPSVPCGDTTSSVMSLVPLYQTILLPIYPDYWPHKGNEMIRIIEDTMFKRQHGVTPNDLILLAEKGRVIPYFSRPYDRYNEKIIEPLLQPGTPRISYATMMLIRNLAMITAVETAGNETDWTNARNLAAKEIGNLDFPREKELAHNCTICLSVCYALGLRKYFETSEFGFHHACFVTYALSTQSLDAVLQTECPLARDVLSNMGNLPEGIPIEYILKGLKVKYSPDIPLEEYVDVFDSKTSRALREILSNILGDPLSKKYTERLNAKIYDLNRQVEELAEAKTAKIFEAVSDMALYGGKKLIESQTQKLVRVPRKGFIRLGEWLASRGIDLAAKRQKKDWSIAQLYKARCKLKRCK